MLVDGLAIATRNMSELLDELKRNPGKHTMVAAGNGSSNHLAGAMFANIAGVKELQAPYKGDTPALTDVMAGHGAQEMHKSGVELLRRNDRREQVQRFGGVALRKYLRSIAGMPLDGGVHPVSRLFLSRNRDLLIEAAELPRLVAPENDANVVVVDCVK